MASDARSNVNCPREMEVDPIAPDFNDSDWIMGATRRHRMFLTPKPTPPAPNLPEWSHVSGKTWTTGKKALLCFMGNSSAQALEPSTPGPSRWFWAPVTSWVCSCQSVPWSSWCRPPSPAAGGCPCQWRRASPPPAVGRHRSLYKHQLHLCYYCAQIEGSSTPLTWAPCGFPIAPKL